MSTGSVACVLLSQTAVSANGRKDEDLYLEFYNLDENGNLLRENAVVLVDEGFTTNHSGNKQVIEIKNGLGTIWKLTGVHNGGKPGSKPEEINPTSEQTEPVGMLVIKIKTDQQSHTVPFTFGPKSNGKTREFKAGKWTFTVAD